MDKQKLMNELLGYRKRRENPPAELISAVARVFDMTTGSLLAELNLRFDWPRGSQR